MSINVAIEVNPLLDSDWFKIGGSHDVDTVIRAAGFDSGDEVAKLVVSAEGHEPVTVSAITLGEHRIEGLPDTDMEDEDVSYDKEYIHQHLQSLEESCCVSRRCWLSVDVSGMEDSDFRISDEYVSGSIGQVLKELPWLLKEAGHTAIGEQLDEAYEFYDTSAYLEVFTQSNCLISPDLLGDHYLDSLSDSTKPDASSDMSN